MDLLLVKFADLDIFLILFCFIKLMECFDNVRGFTQKLIWFWKILFDKIHFFCSNNKLTFKFFFVSLEAHFTIFWIFFYFLYFCLFCNFFSTWIIFNFKKSITLFSWHSLFKLEPKFTRENLACRGLDALCPPPLKFNGQ